MVIMAIMSPAPIFCLARYVPDVRRRMRIFIAGPCDGLLIPYIMERMERFTTLPFLGCLSARPCPGTADSDQDSGAKSRGALDDGG
jgi:hypothetical protein